MASILGDLIPKDIFYYFELISGIPRGSGNEKAISDFMVQFAKEKGLWVKQDEAYNVYIKKPASVGYEKCAPVILQGHLDMVCEKNKESEHDFINQGLELVVEGDWIKAKDTTLGADDGVAIAYQMAILADNTLKHPPLEIVMTTDEERGMTGAAHLHPEYLQGRRLINLDTEKEGEFLVSCAGGIRGTLKFDLEYVPIKPNQITYEIVVRDLLGGHSGADIHLERANAHILMGRILSTLKNRLSFLICDMVGGTKDNVITRTCEARIVFPKEGEDILRQTIEEMQDIFKEEYSIQDPYIKVEANCAAQAELALSETLTDKIIKLLILIPNGVIGFSHSLKDLVETSLNLGIVAIEEGSILFSTAIRSSVPSKKYELVDKLKSLADLLGANFTVKADYPAWTYEENSKLRDTCVTLYKNMYGKDPEITAIHAGLECGYLAKKLKGVDMIALGPDVVNIHSPEEKVSISSMARVYEYLKVLLENLNK